MAPGEGHLMLLDPASAALPIISDFLLSDDATASSSWRQSVEVDSAMLDATLPKGCDDSATRGGFSVQSRARSGRVLAFRAGSSEWPNVRRRDHGVQSGVH